MIGDLLGRRLEAIDVEVRGERRAGDRIHHQRALAGPPTGPLSATVEVVGLSRSPLIAPLTSLWFQSAPVTPGSPAMLAVISCLPAEVTVLATRYWSALGPLPPRVEQERGLARQTLRARPRPGESWLAPSRGLRSKAGFGKRPDCPGRPRHSPDRSGEAAPAQRLCATSDEASVGPLSLQVTP